MTTAATPAVYIVLYYIGLKVCYRVSRDVFNYDENRSSMAVIKACGAGAEDIITLIRNGQLLTAA